MEAMQNYAWPGNARELENVIRIVVMNDEQTIEGSDLPTFARFSVLRTTGVNRTLAEWKPITFAMSWRAPAAADAGGRILG